ncbi:MAG TPA: GAF domain-containing protein [Plantibacter sp.]|uniref:GAF domain-containing protein n=1 Tax=Plantibacter sp. TaxID=1871045 RepID=UPI002C28B2BA|nr:GAF domain-containing protein [Plantibacter sp.]
MDTGRNAPAATTAITFETLFEQSPFSTQILSPDGRTLRVNRAWEELWGVTLEQIADYNMLEDPQLVETGLMPYVQRGFAGEVIASPAVRYDPDRTLPNRTSHPDPVRWVRAFMFPIRDDRGALAQIVLVHEDVSTEKRTEQDIAAALAEQTALRDRLAALSDASGTLLASLELADVLPAIGTIAERLIAADAYAVWTGEDGSTEWDVVWQQGLSTDFLSRMERWTALGVDDRAALEHPLLVEDVASLPFLAPRRSAYAVEGIRSLLIIPLSIGGALRGIVVAYHREPATFTDADQRLAIAFGHLASAALTTAELYETQRTHRASAEESERRAAFLAQAGAVLSSSLDYQQTLRAVATLAVPRVADWCAVDVVIGARLDRLAVAHVDPEKVELALSLHRDYPDSPEAPSLVRRVVQSGVPAHVHRITDELLVASARGETHLRTLRSLGLASLMCVPLRAHGETLGALTFVSSDAARLYEEADVRFAEDLASHAALAVANARSYDEAREARALYPCT